MTTPQIIEQILAEKLCKVCKKELINDKHYLGLCSKHRTEYFTKWRQEHRESVRKTARKYRMRMKDEAYAHYAGSPPKCACCGEKEMVFLTLDHINNDGRRHRKEIGKMQLAAWVRKNNYPKEFQVLCFNCNCGKNVNKRICPHELILKKS